MSKLKKTIDSLDDSSLIPSNTRENRRANADFSIKKHEKNQDIKHSEDNSDHVSRSSSKKVKNNHLLMDRNIRYLNEPLDSEEEMQED